MKRVVAAFTAFAFFSFQLFTPFARAEQEPIPQWLKEDRGGWLSAKQAQGAQRADQELLTRLAAIQENAQRLTTRSDSGIEALQVDGQLLAVRDPQRNVLLAPVLDSAGAVQDGTLLLADGTLQVFRQGALVRQVDLFGNETFFRTDGRADYEVAADGIRSDYSYDPVRRVTHLANGDLLQDYDAQGRLTRAAYPDGEVLTYSEGRPSGVTMPDGSTYAYSPVTNANGEISLTLSRVGPAPDSEVPLPDGTRAFYSNGWLREIRGTAGTTRYTYSFAPDGTPAQITVTQPNGSSRAYSGQGDLRVITDADGTGWEIAGGWITQKTAPNGAVSQFSRATIPFGQQIVRQTAGVIDRFSFDATGALYAAGTDRNLGGVSPFVTPAQTLSPAGLTKAGIVATDGKYLYVKPWADSTKSFTKVGTGFGGTVAGKVYGTLAGTVSGTISAFAYSDGFLYQPDPTTPTRLEKINTATGAKQFLSVPAGFLNLATATAVKGNVLTTTDGRYVYNLSYHQTRNTTAYNGWTVRVFDPQNNWAVVKTFTAGTASFAANGLMSDGTFLYAMEWTGANTARVAVIRISDGAVVQTWTTAQKTLQAAGGQYDWVNQRFWLGNKTAGKIYSFSDPDVLPSSAWQAHEGLTAPVAETQLPTLTLLPQPKPPTPTDLPAGLIYRPDGSLKTVIQPDGTATLLSGLQFTRSNVTRLYDSTGQLSGLTLADGAALTFQTETLSGVDLPDGTRVTGGVYDSAGRLTSGIVALADGRVVRYADGRPAEATLPDGSKVGYTNGNPSKLTLPDGVSYVIARSGSDEAISWVATAVRAEPVEARTDALTSMTYSTDWVLREAERADGAHLTYTVIASGETAKQSRLSTLTQPDGTVISYAYDDAGRLANTLAVSPNPAEPSIRSEYAYDRIRKVFKGNTLVYDYSYEFEQDGAEITTLHEISTRLTKRYRAGLLISQSDPSGAVSTYEYSSHGTTTLQNAVRIRRTLEDGAAVHYTRTGSDITDWRFLGFTLPGSSEIIEEIPLPYRNAYDLDLPNEPASMNRMLSTGTIEVLPFDALDLSIQSAVGATQQLSDGSVLHYQPDDTASVRTWHLSGLTLADDSYLSLDHEPTTMRTMPTPLSSSGTVAAGSGVIGKGLQFNENSPGYLGVKSRYIPINRPDFTLSLWVNLGDPAIGSDMPILSGIGGLDGFRLIWDCETRTFQFSTLNSRNEVVATASTPGEVLVNHWYLVTAWYSFQTKTIQIQVDNGAMGTASTSRWPFFPEWFYVGTAPNDPHLSPLDGQLDELGIWNRVLTSEERSDLYNGGAGNRFNSTQQTFEVNRQKSLRNDLRVYYDMEETSGVRYDRTSLSPFFSQAARDPASIRSFIQKGKLQLVQPPASSTTIENGPVLVKSTISYLGKPRETFTYNYSPSFTHITDSAGIIRTYDSSDRLISIEQPDGTLHFVTYSRDLSEAQQSRLSQLPISDPETLNILQNPEGAEVVIHRLQRMPDHSAEDRWLIEDPADFPPDTVIEQEFDARGNLLSQTTANGQTTLYENGRAIRSIDPSGSVTIDYEYDDAGHLTKITLLGARQELADRITQTRAEIPAQQARALEELARQRGAAFDQLNQQYTQNRGQLQNQLAVLNQNLSDLENTNVHGRNAKRAKGQAMDQIRHQINLTRTTFSDLDSQYAQALGQLDSQVESVRGQIDVETAKAFEEVARQEVELTKEILHQEISSIILQTYRTTIGRDPSEAETDQEIEQLYAQYGFRPDAALNLSELVERIKALPDYSNRVDQVTLIKSQVTAWLTHYGSLRGNEAAAAISSLGLSPDETVPLSEFDIQKILDWINSRGLHFGQSAFLALQEFLYASLQGNEAAEALFSPGLSSDEAVSSSESKIQKILSWINSSGLHLSPFILSALQKSLSMDHPQPEDDEQPLPLPPDLISLAVNAILIDILVGVLHPEMDQNRDLEISLFTLQRIAEQFGVNAVSAQVALDDLDNLLEAEDSGDDLPVIAHVSGNHYIVILHHDGSKIVYREPNAGPTGQILTMSEEQFLKIWKGYVLAARAPPQTWQVLSSQEAQRITGSFFPLLFLFIAQVVTAVFNAAVFVVNTVVVLLVNLASAFTGIFNAIGSIIAPFKGLAAAFEGFGAILSGQFAAGLQLIGQGLLFSVGLGGGFQGLGQFALQTALNIGLSHGLEALGLDPAIARIGSAFLTPIATASISTFAPLNLSYTLTDAPFLGLTSVAIAGTQIGLVKAGLDANLASIAGIGVGAITSSITSGVKVPGAYDPITKQPIPDNIVPWHTATGLGGLSYTLSTQLAPTLAGELAFYGVNKLGASLGVDPRISLLAGIPVRQTIGSYLIGAKTETILQGMGAGLLRGATSIGFESAAQELNLDPLIGSIATVGISGAIKALLENQNPLQAVADTYFNSITGLLTLGGLGTTPWDRALYLSKVVDFSRIIREQGIGTALETYVTSILNRQTIENIWKLGGIYDLLANRDKIEFRTNSEGIQVKRIYVDTQKRDYIELALDDDRLLGKREGNIVMHCDYVIGPDGKSVMRNGETEVLSSDDAHIIRRDVIKNFKLVSVRFYDLTGKEVEEVAPLNEGGIALDKDGNVINGIRINKEKNVTAAFLNGRIIKLTWGKTFTPNANLQKNLMEQGFTENEVKTLTRVVTYVPVYGHHQLTAEVVTSEGNIVSESYETWSYLTRALTFGMLPEPKTTVTLDRNRGVAQVDMALTWPDPALSDVFGFLPLWIASNNIEWSTATRDAVAEIGSLIGNGDASFIFTPGVNSDGLTLDQIAQLKASLGSDKKIVVGHSAGTEAVVRAMFTIKADKYILASPRMNSFELLKMMNDAGIKPEQVIVVTTRGDFPSDDLLGNIPYQDNGTHWTNIHIEDGPGVNWWPFSSHSVPIDGWLGGQQYKISVNGGPLEERPISKILKEQVEK